MPDLENRTQNMLEHLQGFKPTFKYSMIKLVCFGWPTAFRKHFDPKPCCFGCQNNENHCVGDRSQRVDGDPGPRDDLQHYIRCKTLWPKLREMKSVSEPVSSLETFGLESENTMGSIFLATVALEAYQIISRNNLPPSSAISAMHTALHRTSML